MTQQAGAPINWRAMFAGLRDGIVRFWPLILIALIVLLVMSACSEVRWPWSEKTGREVTAEYNQQSAEVRETQANAEANRAQAVIPIVENHGRRRAQTQAQVEATREAIAAAPDLDLAYDAYRDGAIRMRYESRTATERALSQHRASIDP